MADQETLTLFEEQGGRAATTTSACRNTTARESFLTGLLATWAANDRDPGGKPTGEEKRRAREGARAALGEIRR